MHSTGTHGLYENAVVTPPLPTPIPNSAFPSRRLAYRATARNGACAYHDIFRRNTSLHGNGRALESGER